MTHSEERVKRSAEAGEGFRRPFRAQPGGFLHCVDGAVQMEYILVCSLIAVASVLAVIVFARGIISMFHVDGYALTGQEEAAQKAREAYIEDREKDFDKAKEYVDEFHR